MVERSLHLVGEEGAVASGPNDEIGERAAIGARCVHLVADRGVGRSLCDGAESSAERAKGDGNITRGELVVTVRCHVVTVEGRRAPRATTAADTNHGEAGVLAPASICRMFDGSLRKPFDRAVAPLGVGLQKMGVSPDIITVFGVGMAAACAAAIGTGRFQLAFLLLLLTGLPDALDGAVAKAAGIAGPRGAFLDSVSDRLSDGLLFAGAGWYLAGTDEPRMAMLPFALFIAASMVSYMRAKAESLGFDAKGGLMERAERFIVLAFGLLFSSLFVPVLWLMFVLTVATGVFRFHKVWKQATALRPVPDDARRRTRRRQARASNWQNRARSRTRARSRQR